LTRIILTALVSIGVLVAGRPASAVTLDFETLPDLQPVTNQFAGLTFANTTALVSGAVGGSLNEIDFPPLSGVVVVFDDGGPITITFTSPISEASGFLNYAVAVTVTAFDALLAPVASAVTAFGSNLALSGDAGSTPNELVQVAFAGGITSLTLQGDPGGGSFTLDNFTFVPLEASTATPAPGTLVLVAAALVAAACWRGGRRSNRRRLPNIH
jgi:hypothetical protein